MTSKRKRDSNADQHAVSLPSESETKRKKLSKQSAFPRFEDGDVVISLGLAEGDLVLYRKDLSRMCEYFQKFDEVGWPEGFTLQGTKDGPEHRVVPVSWSYDGVWRGL